jgi:hypothetical protein
VRSSGADVALASESDWRLAGFEKDLVRLAVAAKLSSAPEGAFVELGGYAMRLELWGRATGDIVVDPHTGLVETATVTRELSGSLVAAGDLLRFAGGAPVKELPVVIRETLSARGVK